MSNDQKRPSWVPENAGSEFTTNVMNGIESQHDGMSGGKKRYTPHVKRRKLTVNDYVNGIMNQDITIISRAITLIESNAKKHFELAQEVLKNVLPKAGNSIRIGITGVPGAGKSTFIEAFGKFLLDQGYRVAVLAIDPSSTLTKGSVLGDKTRMELLSREKNCFIRPSPSGGTLGGVTRKTRETMLLCEAAGYDIILVETVGVGQNEVTVRSMVDFFLLLKIAGAGDELQGIKKGVIELADAILINKADGDNITRARIAKAEFEKALHYLKSPTESWTPIAKTCSALNNEGIEDVWEMIKNFKVVVKNSGVFNQRRKEQTLEWVHDMVKEHLLSLFYQHKDIQERLPQIEQGVLNEEITATIAAKTLLSLFKMEN